MDMNRKASHARPRVIVITDISSMQSGVLEPDDTQSLIRFLLRKVVNAYGASWEKLAERLSWC